MLDPLFTLCYIWQNHVCNSSMSVSILAIISSLEIQLNFISTVILMHIKEKNG